MKSLFTVRKQYLMPFPSVLIATVTLDINLSCIAVLMLDVEMPFPRLCVFSIIFLNHLKTYQSFLLETI